MIAHEAEGKEGSFPNIAIEEPGKGSQHYRDAGIKKGKEENIRAIYRLIVGDKAMQHKKNRQQKKVDSTGLYEMIKTQKCGTGKMAFGHTAMVTIRQLTKRNIAEYSCPDLDE